jgi:hypothetical protein
MRLDYLPDDLNRLWKELASNPVQVSPDDLRREARKLRTRLRLRNSFVAGVCCFVIAAYCFFFFRSTTALERIGSVVSIAGTAYVIVQFLRRPARSIPLHRHEQINTHSQRPYSKGDISTLPARGHFYFALTPSPQGAR